MCRAGEEGFRRRVLDHTPIRHEHQPGAHLARELHLVRDNQHRHALTCQALNNLQHLTDQFGVERGGRLVEQHQDRPHREGTGDGDPLLLPAGKLRRPLGHVFRQAYPVQMLGRHPACLRQRRAEHSMRADGHIIERRQMREQVEALKHHADLPALARGLRRAIRHDLPVAKLAFHVDPRQDDIALGGDFDAVDTAQDRGLPGPARPDHHHDLTGGHVQVHPVHNWHPGIDLRQPADFEQIGRGPHASPLMPAAPRHTPIVSTTQKSSPDRTPPAGHRVRTA